MGDEAEEGRSQTGGHADHAAESKRSREKMKPPHTTPQRPPRQRRQANPLQSGIQAFLNSLYQQRSEIHRTTTITAPITTPLLSNPPPLSPLPKRYTLYSPLLLLPANVFSATAAWQEFYSTTLSGSEKQELHACIAESFRNLGVTHIGVNAPISAEVGDGRGGGNIMRSPGGIVPLYGDFGPVGEVASRAEGREGNSPQQQPTAQDFAATFWVRAVQNGGIVQIWAPMWTMFSRGNIKEKARILGDETTRTPGSSVFAGLDGQDGVLAQRLQDISVVDFYVGVGYFAFSYLRRGVGRVWGWEISGWSVEGLRRGCEENGWSSRVLTIDEEGVVRDESGRVGEEALRGLVDVEDVRCVVFLGDNRWAEGVMSQLKAIYREKGAAGSSNHGWKDVRHANLGLLPTSRESWKSAVGVLDDEKGGWVHVHENVDVKAMSEKEGEIVRTIREHVVRKAADDHQHQAEWQVVCHHVEQVKTFAPDVMHTVFDIQILKLKAVGTCSSRGATCFNLHNNNGRS